ncbi:ATP-binding cassette, subfamily C [Streptomyces misionensis]|uniref:ATP-binding cassette, subfamily C n=1 Tax=Streptomyces misionensis TaxID=67331 RepID=A0A1H5GHD9_9ACTN|nr:ATP-binding cassette, subfamily C [Streptomyces misionensis]
MTDVPEGRAVRVSWRVALAARWPAVLRTGWPVLARLAGWSLLEAGQTFLLGYALARALDGGFLAGDTRAGLLWLGAAGLAVVAGAYGTGRVYGAVAALVEPVRDRLVRGVVARGIREGDAGALSGLTQQVELARDALAGVVLVSRSFLFTSVGALIGLCSLDPLLLAVVVPPLLAGTALFAVTLRPLARRQEAFLAADEALAEDLGTVCPGLRDVTAAGAEARVAEATGKLIGAERRAAYALARWGVTRVAALAVGGQLPVVLLLVTAPWLLGHGVTPGALVGALAYVTQSLLPALQNLVHGLGTSGSRLTVILRRLTAQAQAQAQAQASVERRPSGRHAEDTAGRPPRPARLPALSLTAVTFSYGPASTPVLDGFHLDLPAGGHLAVVGPSGIGKSTLAALVAGLLRPDRGSVRVFGRPVEQAAGARVLVPQEAYVHSGTLAENLALYREGPVPEAELLAAAEAVGLTPLLRTLGGPGAPVDPAALSAGERQLIALTRAYLSPAPLALLDEATCHLDPAAEARAERAFANRPGGTLVVVAHRISSARRADRILVMDGARTACGGHEELLRACALYRELVGGWSDPALAPGYADGVDAIAGAGLAGDRGHVVADRAVGQMQTAGDLGDGGSSGRE